jgi:hypothetical protein
MAVLQDGYWPGTVTSQYLATGGTWSKVCQSFTTGGDGDYTIEQIGVSVIETAGSGDLHVELYAANANDFPTGAILSSGYVEEGSVNNQTPIPGNPDETTITMSAVVLSQNTKYVLVMYTESTGVGWPPTGVKWCGVAESGDSLGKPAVYVIATDEWLSKPTYETAFRVYGTDGAGGDPPEKPINPVPANAATSVRKNQATIAWEAGV